MLHGPQIDSTLEQKLSRSDHDDSQSNVSKDELDKHIVNSFG